MHKPTKYHVEFMSKRGVRVQSFNSRGEQLRFAYRLNSPGIRLTTS